MPITKNIAVFLFHGIHKSLPITTMYIFSKMDSLTLAASGVLHVAKRSRSTAR